MMCGVVVVVVAVAVKGVQDEEKEGEGMKEELRGEEDEGSLNQTSRERS